MTPLYKRYRDNKVRKGADGIEDLLAEQEQATRRENFGSVAGLAASLGTGIIDATTQPDIITGRTPTGAVIGKSALSGAAMGSSLGPLGAGIGAVIGAGIGLFSAKKQKKDAMSTFMDTNRMRTLNEASRSAAMYGTNPELVNGHKRASYFADGGMIQSPLMHLMMKGGRAKPLASDSVELKGNRHKDGGIYVPELDTELEDGETTKGNFVFSAKLGFAQQHKPLAKARGIIEDKPPTAERINSIKRLNARENELGMLQELLKRKINSNA